jgi:hypothetical protein
MAIEMLTYAVLAERLKISPEAARALAKRLRLQRSRSNDGKTLLSVDLAEIQHTPKPARSPAGDRLDKGKIETLQAEIARLKELAAGHRADFERERDRFDRTMIELMRATTDAMIAREEAAYLKGEAAAPRWRLLAGWLRRREFDVRSALSVTRAWAVLRGTWPAAKLAPPRSRPASSG